VSETVSAPSGAISDAAGHPAPEVVLSAQNLSKTFQLNRRGLGGGVALPTG
jgi:hypothetical protein